MLAAAGNDAVLARLSNGYQPASLSIIEAPIDDWAALDPDKCQIVDLLDPLDYNAPARPTRWT